MNYHYFVSYLTLEDGNFLSAGMCDYYNCTKIESFEDIINMTSEITENLNVEQVLILNYKLIREEPY